MVRPGLLKGRSQAYLLSPGATSTLLLQGILGLPINICEGKKLGGLREEFRKGGVQRGSSVRGILHPVLDFIALFRRECARNRVDSGEGRTVGCR